MFVSPASYGFLSRIEIDGKSCQNEKVEPIDVAGSGVLKNHHNEVDQLVLLNDSDGV